MRRSRPETVPVSGTVSTSGPRLARIGAWAALAAGPLALAVALVMPRGPVAQAASVPHADSASRLPADPAGTAALFVELWLRSDAAETDSPVAAALRSMAPSVQLPKRVRGEATPGALRVVPVRTVSSPDGWTVVVAALTNASPLAPAASSPAPEPAAGTGPVVRYFAVSGTGGRDGGPLSVSASPAEVSAPESSPETAAGPFSHAVPSGAALSASLGEFLRTYLAGGQGAGLERYLSPGVRLSAPAAAGYVRVDVEDVMSDTERAAGKEVPADGTRARVRVRVTGEDRARTRWPLVYQLEVTTRAGRWEISALKGGAAGAATPAVAPSGSVAAPVAGGAR
ncbi:conjugal transfer protein [Streptomyces polychromogenes]|uniref:Conjugal transfer protein n=1 Tax=Streptomyces polychromogenes TaxID=67342 RepID=A0ABN0V102_9ACTN